MNKSIQTRSVYISATEFELQIQCSEERNDSLINLTCSVNFFGEWHVAPSFFIKYGDDGNNGENSCNDNTFPFICNELQMSFRSSLNRPMLRLRKRRPNTQWGNSVVPFVSCNINTFGELIFVL